MAAPTVRNPLTPAGQRLLDAAGDLFYARGIRAVGVDAIAEAAGTTKKTLYDRFGSKDALVALYLERRTERWRAYVAEFLDAHAPAAGDDRVLAVLDCLGAWLAEHTRGCGFVNAHAEVGGTDHPAVAVIRADKAWIRELYATLLVEAGRDVAAAAALGAQLAVVHEGAIVMATAGAQPDAIEVARDAAEALLEARP